MRFKTRIAKSNANATLIQEPGGSNFRWVPRIALTEISRTGDVVEVELKDDVAKQLKWLDRSTAVVGNQPMTTRPLTAVPRTVTPTDMPQVDKLGRRKRIDTLQCGRYTVCFDGKLDDYVTLRVSEWNDGTRPGVLIFAFLKGPDNSKDFIKFCNVDETGRLVVWRHFKAGFDRQVRAVTELIDMEVIDRFKAGETYALKSSNCCICGRDLTKADSIRRGMGYDCFMNHGPLDEVTAELKARVERPKKGMTIQQSPDGKSRTFMHTPDGPKEI